ncbi:hypothetical protein LTR05_002805 [Lithohypha guttulata]|uniref:Major facilitator superfamily (MFS) profile domain-containing protein n=1 Tax=Lithohypha guttulata TaxID=1690604 RepID=A0AAN7Y8E1_9EURO|nr:hypothetical protein LTR05_002805 [Lithohypha guttulata]
MPQQQTDERTQLLKNGRPNAGSNNNDAGHSSAQADSGDEADVETVDFETEDDEDPHYWPNSIRYLQVFLIFIIGLICPMSSSIFAPGIDTISSAFGTSNQAVIGAQTGFVCMLGIGPLFFAPMSETFGRRPVFLINLTLFTLMQIPSALAPNIASFIVFRTLSGLFGSVSVANGGGTVSDLFQTHERATVLGFYLLGTIVLQQKKERLEKENEGKKYKIKGVSDMGLFQKISGNSTRACKILFQQPVVLTMSTYQALIFSTMYSLYTNFSSIWSDLYGFDTTEVALSYLGPATGFILTACIIVPFIDRIYNNLAKTRNNGKGKPEYRLPLANIGAICLPVSLFWFGWTVEYQKPWPVSLSAMLLFGASQVSIFNTVQNYYIDAFESMAASALAAGAFLRSMVGGIVPLFVPMLIDKLGYGWGLSLFGFLAAILTPAPLLFYWYGERLRQKFAVDL